MSFIRQPTRAMKGSRSKTADAKQPTPGDWLVYTLDRKQLLEFGADLDAIRQRLASKKIRLADCFLSRQQEPLLLGAAEIEIV